MSEREKRSESFVVWLDPGDETTCAGRVEHVATSRRGRFQTLEQLEAFLLESARIKGPSGSPVTDSDAS